MNRQKPDRVYKKREETNIYEWDGGNKYQKYIINVQGEGWIPMVFIMFTSRRVEKFLSSMF